MKRPIQITLTAAALLLCSAAWAHDGSASCNRDVEKLSALEKARGEVKQKPRSVGLRTELAEALIGIGCYDEAVHILEDGVKLLPNDRNLQTKLKTAKSFIEESEHLNNQPATSTVAGETEFLRLQLRCRQVGDPQACDQAFAMRPNDVSLLIAKGDAFLRERRSKEALVAFNRAKQFPGNDVDLSARINTAQVMLGQESPPAIAQKATPITVPTAAVAAAPRYSNVEPASRSN